jgi:hypothetical protein
MATAPRPGKARQDDEREHSRHLFYRLTVRGEELTLRQADIGPSDAAMVRRETGMTLRSLLQATYDTDTVDLDVIATLWWLAQRKAGNEIAYQVALDKFPSYAEMADGAVRFLLDTEGASDIEDPDSPEA